MWHHHGSDTPTFARAILHHTDQKGPNILKGSVVYYFRQLPKKCIKFVKIKLFSIHSFYKCILLTIGKASCFSNQYSSKISQQFTFADKINLYLSGDKISDFRSEMQLVALFHIRISGYFKGIGILDNFL